MFERLLLFSGQGYVQGMNEIIGPIYYVFASDPRPEWKGILTQILIQLWLTNEQDEKVIINMLSFLVN